MSDNTGPLPLLSDEQLETSGSTRRMNLATMVESAVSRPLKAMEVRDLYEAARRKDRAALQAAADALMECEHSEECGSIYVGTTLNYIPSCDCGRDAALSLLSDLGITPKKDTA